MPENAISKILAEKSPERRAQLAKEFQESEEFKESEAGSLLAALQKEAFKPGTHFFEIEVIPGEKKRLVVDIPGSYDRTKPTPLILCYHPSGGGAQGTIGMVRHGLRDSVKDFILAGLDDAGPYNIDSKRSWKPETRTMLRFLKQTFSINSNRLYLSGFSQGAYAVWSNAAYFGDEFAAGHSSGATFDAAPEIPGLWDTLLKGTKHTPVLYTWGDQDTLQVFGIDIQTITGTIDKLNPTIAGKCQQLGLPHVAKEVKGAGHTYLFPTECKPFFEMVRGPLPTEIDQSFRYINQGRVAWVEPLKWEGEHWGLGPRFINQKTGETKEQAFSRMLLPLLANVKAKRSGNRIDIETRHVGELVIWLSKDMVDWNEPMEVYWNGSAKWKGKLEPSLAICLNQFERTQDADRLWWAGLRLPADSKARPISDDEVLPELVWERPGQ